MLVCPSELPPSFGDAAHNSTSFEYEMKTMRRRNDSLLLSLVEEKKVPVLPDEIIQSIGWAVRTRCAKQDDDSSDVVSKGYKAEDLLNMMLVCKSWYNTLSPILYRDITTARPHLLVQSCSSAPACPSIRSKSQLLASCRRLHLKPPASFRLSNGHSGSYNEHIFRRNVDSISDQLSCVSAEGGLGQALPNLESVSYGAKSPDPDHGQASLKAIENQAGLIKKILGTKEVLRKKYTDLEKQWIGVLQSIQAPIQCHWINASTTYNRPPAVQVVPTDETSQRTHGRIFHFDLPSVSERWPIVLGARAVYACPAINSNVLYSGLEDFLHVIDFIIAKGREMVTDVAKHRSLAQRQDHLGMDVCFQIPQSIVDPLAELISDLDESPHEMAILRALREIKKYSDENQETAETVGLDRWDIQVVDDLDTCEACNRAFGATETDVLDWTLGRLWP